MTRWLVVFAAVFAGCVMTLPGDPTITADLAVETSRAILAARRPDAVPDSTPKPGDTCEPCSGTGRLPTDGRVVITCDACGGTGRVR
jgi:hypothetical protein